MNTRNIILRHWYHNKTIPEEIKSIIHCYCYPIPFNTLSPYCTFEISSKFNKYYKFEKINDIFAYKRNDKDAIYCDEEPIIPNILTLKALSTHSNSNDNKLYNTKLQIDLTQIFKKQNDINSWKYTKDKSIHRGEYLYDGKDEKQIPNIWKCHNGLKIKQFRIVKINWSINDTKIIKTIKCYNNANNECINMPLPVYYRNILQNHIDLKANLSNIIIEIATAPLRLIGEKQICILKKVNKIYLNDIKPVDDIKYDMMNTNDVCYGNISGYIDPFIVEDIDDIEKIFMKQKQNCLQQQFDPLIDSVD